MTTRQRAIAILTVSLAALLLAGGCWGLAGGGVYPGAHADPTQAADMAVTEQVATAKAQADAQPGDAQAAIVYAELLGAAFEGGTVQRGRLAGDAMVPDALAKLDLAIAQAAAAQAAELTAVKGNLLLRTGRADEALAQYEASMVLSPNLVALAPLIEIYAPQRRHDEIDAHCQASRDLVTDDERRFAVLAWCASARPGMAGADALPWASAEDVAFYEEQVAIEQARAQAEYEAEMARHAQAEAQRAADEEARRQAEASRASSGGGASAPAHYSASVTVRSDCRDKVRLFRGGVSSGGHLQGGTHGWHSANTTASYHLSGDDQLCITGDNDRDVISCTKPPAGSSTVTITSSCSGFR